MKKKNEMLANLQEAVNLSTKFGDVFYVISTSPREIRLQGSPDVKTEELAQEQGFIKAVEGDILFLSDRTHYTKGNITLIFM